MFDFRYHALSLVAVFLALAIGILLGVAIGDAGLVSSAKHDIEQSLRGDVRAARSQVADMQTELDRHRSYEEQTYPELVSGRLAGEEIGLLFLGGSDDGIVDQVRNAVEPAGARLRWVAVVREPPDLQGMAGRLTQTRWAGLDGDSSLLGSLSERLGAQLIRGGKLVSQVRSSLLQSFSGRLGPTNAVVVVRSPTRPDETGDQVGTTAALEDGLVHGLYGTDAPVVGVEDLDADPSQVSWYRDHDLSSVDSVDQLAGQAALVFALGGADGAYGVKPTAEALLPRVVGSVTIPERSNP